MNGLLVKNIIKGNWAPSEEEERGQESRGERKSWTHGDTAFKVEEFQKSQWRR
jgi:hypothetical protein